jgi:predicted RNase H-like nuclease (RuvC/YqgF family)
LRSQLETEKTRYKELEEEHEDVEKWWRESKAKVTALEAENSELKKQLAAAPAENSDLKQKSAAAREVPEAAKILNQLKSKRKKSKTDLADLEVILEILES